MSDDSPLGFHHHHSDEELRRWMAVPAERKLRWLAESLELTSALLPKERLHVWLAMRGEEPGASVAIETLRDTWPRFIAALAEGEAAVIGLAADLRSAGATRVHVRETLLALGHWAPYREGASPDDARLLEAALRGVA